MKSSAVASLKSIQYTLSKKKSLTSSILLSSHANKHIEYHFQCQPFNKKWRALNVKYIYIYIGKLSDEVRPHF